MMPKEMKNMAWITMVFMLKAVMIIVMNFVANIVQTGAGHLGIGWLSQLVPISQARFIECSV